MLKEVTGKTPGELNMKLYNVKLANYALTILVGFVTIFVGRSQLQSNSLELNKRAWTKYDSKNGWFSVYYPPTNLFAQIWTSDDTLSLTTIKKNEPHFITSGVSIAFRMVDNQANLKTTEDLIELAIKEQDRAPKLISLDIKPFSFCNKHAIKSTAKIEAGETVEEVIVYALHRDKLFQASIIIGAPYTNTQEGEKYLSYFEEMLNSVHFY